MDRHWHEWYHNRLILFMDDYGFLEINYKFCKLCWKVLL